jgi:hypothetical protein
MTEQEQFAVQDSSNSVQQAEPYAEAAFAKQLNRAAANEDLA